MTARMRRLSSDWEQIKKEFTGHRNIVVTPVEGDPPEKYRITYFLNGIYLLPDGRIETLGRHEVEIALHAEYPRYKPICKIFTPIWHPNFRDGQICIGDIWGAGESLSDIIINIGDMIQYKSWNSYSPLSADAAKWAIENKHLFPVGDVELRKADFTSPKEIEIDLQDQPEESASQQKPGDAPPSSKAADAPDTILGIKAAEDNAPDTASGSNVPGETAENKPFAPPADDNDFDITPEDLAGVEFVPSAQRMQNSSLVGRRKVNFKTILVKGILWAVIGALVGFGVSELLRNYTDNNSVLKVVGYEDIAAYNDVNSKINQVFLDIQDKYPQVDFSDPNALSNLDNTTYSNIMNDLANTNLQDLYSQQGRMAEALVNKYGDTAQYGTTNVATNVDSLIKSAKDAMDKVQKTALNIAAGLWAALLALFLGLFLGIGEGVYYGSARNAVIYSLIGAIISILIGFASGFLAQMLYSELITGTATDFVGALVRGLGWSIMGVGVGLSIGLIKPGIRRILFCTLGGFIGAFIGGFLFDFIYSAVAVGNSDTGLFSRGIAIVIMGLLIGLGIGLLEQFAKSAWLKVIRGEFEGKEYLVFSGTTSIGNNARNTIVLFKDKLVGPHHCDIVLQGHRYVLVDSGTPMGTIVNGMRIQRHTLRNGDSIALGNSVLVFNTK